MANWCWWLDCYYFWRCRTKWTAKYVLLHINIILHINRILPILYIKDYIFSDYNKKQSTNKKNFNSALDRIADAFCERNKQAPSILLPDPSQNDEVDAIVSVVEQRLRKLPPNMLDDAAQKLFQITYDLIKKTEY